MILVHQVRHPLPNIANLLESGIFRGEAVAPEVHRSVTQATIDIVHKAGRWDSNGQIAHRRYLEFYRPEVVINDPVRAALRYWVLWNLELEFYAPSYADAFTVQVERLNHLTLRDPIVASGRTQVLEKSKRISTTSYRSKSGIEIASEDLPKCWELDLAEDLAKRLRYSM